jgi:hypothetical protein
LIVFTIVSFFVSIALNVIYFTGTTLFGLHVFAPVTHSLHYNHTFLAESKLAVCVWAVIFAWQLLWLAYGVTTIFRKSSSDFLYKYPPVMHWLVYVNFSLANVLYVLALVFWSRDLNMVCFFLNKFVFQCLDYFNLVFFFNKLDWDDLRGPGID